MYRQCYNSEYWQCNVQTIYIHLDNCIYMSKSCIYRNTNICSCICNHKTCTEHVCTIWIYQPKQVHTCYKQPKARYLHVLHAIKKSIIAGLEPRTLCIPASCLNHYATSVHAVMQYLQYIYAFCRTSGAEPAAPPSPAMMSFSSSRRIA